MYIKGWFEPDWYMKNRFVEIVLARHFWIDEAYDLVLVEPVIATSRSSSAALDAAVVDGVVRAFGWRRARREPRCSRCSTARASTARSTGSATAS